MARRSLGLLLSGLAAGALAAAPPAQAHVTRLVIESRTPIAGEFGTAGAYELIAGHVYGEVDPKDRRNAIITDIGLAPKNARGKVEYSATFALAKPVDMARASGVMLYDVPNRGNGRAVGDRDGHIHVISGWQGDIAPVPDKQTAQVPAARNPDGSAVTGPVLARSWLDFGSPATPACRSLGRTGGRCAAVAAGGPGPGQGAPRAPHGATTIPAR